jgi:hypothetical protein
MDLHLSHVLLALWLILIGLLWLTWITINMKLLGGLAVVTGVLVLIEGVHPIVLYRHRV